MRGDDLEGIGPKTNRTHLLLPPSPGHLHFLSFAPGLSSFIVLKEIPMGPALGLKDILKTSKTLKENGQVSFHTRVGKSRFTVVCMENNTIINK